MWDENMLIKYIVSQILIFKRGFAKYWGCQHLQTYRKGNSSFVIDLIFINSALVKGENFWRVDKEFIYSNHQDVVWEVYIKLARPMIGDVSTGCAGIVENLKENHFQK